jgi:hypothetical protein
MTTVNTTLVESDRLSAPDPSVSAAAAHVGERVRLLRVALALACCLLVAVPFVSVRFPPITDLPQHLAQIRLFHEAIATPDSPYRVQWLTPYIVAYVPLAFAWWLSPSPSAGPIAMVSLALLWTVAIHWLAFKRRRPAAAAVLASALFFNHTTYWGFYSFEMGLPVFVLWFLLTSRPEASFRRRDIPLFLVTALLLYLSHALWLAAGTVWFIVRSIVTRAPLRTTLAQLASFSPVLVMAVIWYRRFTASGFTSPTRWFNTPAGRLSFTSLIDATFGGLQGLVEYVALGVLVGWIVLGIHQHRGRLRTLIDRDLALAALLFFSLVLLLPNLHQNTVAFASRWMPLAAILALLAMPAPAWERGVRNAVALTALAAFVVVTTFAWMRFEQDELSGLPESLQALPANMRVIGLDFIKGSSVIKGRPFLQTYAYAQVMRGGELNFSFAQFAPMAVVYRTPRRPAWTGGLEWRAERVKPTDFGHFHYALVNADAPKHASLAALPVLHPVTVDGRWRLYRVGAGGR